MFLSPTLSPHPVLKTMVLSQFGIWGLVTILFFQFLGSPLRGLAGCQELGSAAWPALVTPPPLLQSGGAGVELLAAGGGGAWRGGPPLVRLASHGDSCSCGVRGGGPPGS